MGKLTEYYKKNHELKIFYKEITSSNYEYGLLYIYAFDKEIEYFRETFGAYFPYYVKNEDQLKNLDPDSPNFEEKLKTVSIRNWKRLPIVPQRKTSSSGIYGELFLDFYLRIVLGLDPLISFASKRSYLNNRESTGIDNIVFDEKDSLEIYLSEAKFVYDKNAAKSGLIDDVKGTSGSESHLTSDYINSYMDFVIFKASESNQIKNEKVRLFIDYVNQKYDEGVDFLDVCIEKKVKLNVVLFAIFNELEKDVNKFDLIYKKLSEELENKLSVLSLDSYDYKIVFIPTNNTSMTIKEGINKYYE